MKHTPSAFSVSYAYAISFTEPSTSGSGRIANSPKRPGYLAINFAPKSLQSRASARAFASSPKWTPGSLIDSIDVATPYLSMSSSALVSFHSMSPVCPVPMGRSTSL